MSHTIDPQHSVRLIRRRLFLLLMQAFGAVVLLTVLLLLVLVGLFVALGPQGEAPFAPDLGEALVAYYRGRGSWEAVGSLVDDAHAPGALDVGSQWQRAILLDAAGRVLIDHGQADGPRVGQMYRPLENDFHFPLRVDGAQVGTLVFEYRLLAPESLALLLRLVPPVGFISFFTGTLTLLIGFLLARRVVSPLADVIAAAQSVAGGDLSTRVPVRGPGDLRGLSDSFNRMADALEHQARERRDLLADIAHELRTPLSVMRGRLEGIVDGVYPADEAHVAPVLEETYLLERLVDDLRLLTLAEARQLPFNRQPVDLGEMAERAADLYAAEALEKQVRLGVRVEPGLPCVSADPQRMGQVIGNLLSNALQYVPAHGRVEVSVHRTAAGVELAVSDDGPGVPEADLPRLFDRFWRGEKSRARSAGGAGLGLSIARQLVEAQGGTMTAANLPGGGLRLAFVLA